MEGAVIFFTILLIALILILIIYGYYTKKKQEDEEARKRAETEAKRKVEEERKIAEAEEKRKIEEKRKRAEAEAEEARKRAEEEAEEERKRNTMCTICGKCSMGLVVCRNCFDRSNVLKKELPLKKTKDFETISSFRQELIDKIIFAETHNDREFNCLRLFAITDILKNKYLITDAYDKTYEFLEDLDENGYATSNELIEKYASKKAKDFEEKEENSIDQHENTDFRQRYRATLHCNDGHWVRSKSEREIDNFFYEHRIWHEYEKEYVCHNGKKYYPDFFLSDYNLIIEYFGKKEAEYIETKEEKIKNFSAEPHTNFAYLDYTDDANLTDKLSDICRSYNIPLK